MKIKRILKDTRPKELEEKKEPQKRKCERKRNSIKLKRKKKLMKYFLKVTIMNKFKSNNSD